jgi:RNA polymerase sigma factor (sigma-70 family)
MTIGTSARSATGSPQPSDWRERSARLYEELKRPSRALVRRAFRGAFTDDEIEDVYANAWVGTLRALERRHEELADEEVRKYVLTAVAHHASKELRRRKRRPVTPLDGIHAVPDEGLPPDETAAKREQSRVARDVLSSLPPRRRAVMLLRYGWGLEPQQVCGLVEGLSPRAYRKEITRGVDELAAKLRRVESGEWCGDREPLLKAYASGLADDEQRRQAQQHLSHCRSCSEFVGKLSGHLHDIGSGATIPAAAHAIGDGRFSALDRATDLLHRAKDSAVGALGRNAGDASPETSMQTIGASGGARGAGAAGGGVLAKLVGAGAASKLTAICLGSGVAATACLATGVVPARLPGLAGGTHSKPADQAAEATPAGHPARFQTKRLGAPYEEVESDQPATEAEPDSAPTTTTTSVATPPPATTTAVTATATTTTTTTPIAPSAPPEQQEYGIASAATTSDSGSSSSSGGGSGGGGSAAQQEFGP